jgi:glycosyltransferase involved in cell wall biosynthesis
MRLLLAIHSLGCGGAERVLSTLANAWAERGHEITLLTFADGPSFYKLNSRVSIIHLGLAGNSASHVAALGANARRVACLRKQITDKRPDVFISFMVHCNILTLLASIGTGVPTIVCEHNDPSQYVIGPIWSSLGLLTYPFADAVTFLTENVLQRWRWLRNASVMPNPIVVGESSSEDLPDWPEGSRRMLAVGRLATVKGYDRLLSAFQQVARRFPDWSLTILGEGPERRNLEQQVRALGLMSRISMPGNVKDPFIWMKEADLFVMSSHYEGLPCVLGEAMACGLPAISFDCDSGPRDMIRHEVDGLLVPPNDVPALVNAMERLMSDEGARAGLAKRAPEIMDRYGLKIVLQRWDELFGRLCVTQASTYKQGEVRCAE